METIIILKIAITGIGATLVMDLWSFCQKHLLKVPPLNYALVGRWILWLPRGKFCHNTIISTPGIHGELFTGWVFHYLTGIVFAFVPIVLNGSGWLNAPSLTTGLLAGALTLFAPFILLQPALGFGLAASRTPRPWLARMFSAIAHLVFGLGLYIAVLVVRA